MEIFFLTTAIILLFLVISYAISAIIFRTMFSKNLNSRFEKLIPNSLRKDLSTIEKLEKEEIDWLRNFSDKEQIWLDTKKGKINAYYIKQPTNPEKLVVLIHGYRGNKMQLNSLARYYYEIEKVDLLMVEMLGHGHSSGEYVNFGYYDHMNIAKLIQSIQFNRKSKVMLHGCSMGSLIALWVGCVYPVSAIIADSPYGRLKDNMLDTVPFILIPFIKFVGLFTSVINKKRQGFYIKDIDILNKVDNITAKTLLISGLNDRIVKSRHIKKIQDKMKINPDVWYLENCCHLGAYLVAKEEYQNRIHEYLLDL